MCVCAHGDARPSDSRLACKPPSPNAQQVHADLWEICAVFGDYAAAARWYRAAAEQGDAQAQNNLGVMYEQGNGVAQDHAEAARLFRLAAEQGNAQAQLSLGIMYGNGKGVPQDYVLEHMWANIAAANGHEKAVEFRALLDTMMTSTDISEAQRRARVCMESNYQDCD